MPAQGINVAVTGASGYIGERVVAALCADPSVGSVLGFDVREPRFQDPKFVFDQVDVRSPGLEARFRDVDVCVHLAFIMDPIHDEATMRDVNVNGSQNVFKCAARAKVGRIVYTSSAVVYGAHPDNDFPLTEESPLRANLDFSYPAHKLEVEYVIREVCEEFPDIRFTIFRPAIVFGGHVDNAWSHTLEMPILFSVQGYRAPLQFVHEDDVARAIHHAVTGDLDGVYNLAAPGFLTVEEMLEIVDRRRFELPEPLAFSIAERMWKLGMSETPAGMLHYVMHPWVVATEKLERAGFRCERTNRETFRETVERVAGHVRVGDRRFRRGDIVRGAVAGAGLVGALVTLRTMRRGGLWPGAN